MGSLVGGPPPRISDSEYPAGQPLTEAERKAIRNNSPKSLTERRYLCWGSQVTSDVDAMKNHSPVGSMRSSKPTDYIYRFRCDWLGAGVASTVRRSAVECRWSFSSTPTTSDCKRFGYTATQVVEAEEGQGRGRSAGELRRREIATPTSGRNGAEKGNRSCAEPANPRCTHAR